MFYHFRRCRIKKAFLKEARANIQARQILLSNHHRCVHVADGYQPFEPPIIYGTTYISGNEGGRLLF